MPDAKVFVDANVLLYLHDKRDPEKAAKAERWIRNIAARRIGRTNLQVMNEVSHVLLRKKWFDDPQIVFKVVDDLSKFGDGALTMADIVRARRIHLKTAYSWWDCLLFASAIELGCTHFLSETCRTASRSKA